MRELGPKRGRVPKLAAGKLVVFFGGETIFSNGQTTPTTQGTDTRTGAASRTFLQTAGMETTAGK